MEKLKLGKHNHTLTDLLKVIIFSIVMLAPFFSILFRCLYVATNKNAKDSYSGESTFQINYKYQSNEVNTGNDLVEGNLYKFDLETFYLDVNIGDYVEMNNTKGLVFVDNNELNTNDIRYFTTDFISITKDNGILNIGNDYWGFPVIEFVLTDNPTENANIYNTTLLFTYSHNVDYTIEHLYQYITYTDYNEIESVDINNNGTLDNAFEYSIRQINESTTFNWVQNTALYTPINNMTIGLGFDSEHNTLALLLTYWTLNTAIYIIFDIVIGIFTKLTHIVQN